MREPMQSVNITPEDMVKVLEQNPVAMEQAKVAALVRQNAALQAEVDRLTEALAVLQTDSNGSHRPSTVPAPAA